MSHSVHTLATIPDEFTPVRVNGSTELGARGGYYRADLPDGTAGYMMRRFDDCLQAAIATALQIPMHNVPDLRIDERIADGADPEELNRIVWQEMSRWAQRIGVLIEIRPRLPQTGLWIGIEHAEGLYNGHSYVMRNRRILHDPIRLLRVTDPTLGASFQRAEQLVGDTDDVPDFDYAITLRKD
jgi:hypothetical protein